MKIITPAATTATAMARKISRFLRVEFMVLEGCWLRERDVLA